MKTSINLPLRSDVPLSDQCSHGKKWDEFCVLVLCLVSSAIKSIGR